jgi:amidase
MTLPNLPFLPAVELARLIRERAVSCVEVMQAHLAQIERVNPQVNAIVTLLPEQALAAAREADAALARGDAVGPLHGLPIAHKDLVPTKGIRTTFGSPIFRNFVPAEDALIVERLRAAGAITIGKTNTPEFGAGSQTFNQVFGVTPNPYDLSRTCGGSSGGAAVALACGMIPLADGSDMGGSLRNPAAFCNVVGLRPSPGRVPIYPTLADGLPLSVEGPMARTVGDVALMLSTISGPDARSPSAIAGGGEVFRGSLARDFRGVRVAWSRNLGLFPVDGRVTAALERQRPVFADLGCEIGDAEPDLRDADETFKILRAWSFHMAYGELLQTHRAQMKDTVIWNIEAGAQLSGAQVARAWKLRTAIYRRVHAFFEQYEFLLLPVTQVPPFDHNVPYISEINGVPMNTYIDWMQSCYLITVTGLPAISVPCGFTPEGLPVGLQIVGRHQDELGVLQLAHAFEQATGFWRRHPAVAVGA